MRSRILTRRMIRIEGESFRGRYYDMRYMMCARCIRSAQVPSVGKEL